MNTQTGLPSRAWDRGGRRPPRGRSRVGSGEGPGAVQPRAPQREPQRPRPWAASPATPRWRATAAPATRRPGAPPPWPTAASTVTRRSAIGSRTGEGLHGRLAGTADSPTCHGCHPEHGGPRAALTVLDKEAFPHEVTGFSLATHERVDEGDPVACGDCHPGRLGAVRPGRVHRVSRRARRRVHAPARGHLRRGLPPVPRRQRSRRSRLRSRHDRVRAQRRPRRRRLHGVPRRRPLRRRSRRRRRTTATRATEGRRARRGVRAGMRRLSHRRELGRRDLRPLRLPARPRQRGAHGRCAHLSPGEDDRYTCHGCHEHSRDKVIEQHKGQGLSRLKDCVRCHPGGERPRLDDDDGTASPRGRPTRRRCVGATRRSRW